MRGVLTYQKGKDKKGKPQWKIRWWDGNGKEHSTKVRPNTIAAAEKFQRNKENELLNGDSPKVTIEIKSLFEEMMRFKRDIAQTTRKKYTIDFQHFFDFLAKEFPTTIKDISLIKTVHINEYLEHANTTLKLSKKTCNKSLIPVNLVLNYAIEGKHIENNPTTRVNRFKIDKNIEREYFTKEELEEIWKKVNPYWLPFLKTLYYTGTRISELINLIWKNVDLESERPFIKIISRIDYQTKTGKNRTIPLNQKTVEIIKNQLGKHEKYIFTSPRANGKIGERYPREALKTACEKLKIEGKNTPHKLRHSCASHLVIDNKSLKKIGKLLGHKSLQSTEIYTHLSTDSLNELVDSL